MPSGLSWKWWKSNAVAIYCSIWVVLFKWNFFCQCVQVEFYDLHFPFNKQKDKALSSNIDRFKVAWKFNNCKKQILKIKWAWTFFVIKLVNFTLPDRQVIKTCFRQISTQDLDQCSSSQCQDDSINFGVYLAYFNQNFESRRTDENRLKQVMFIVANPWRPSFSAVCWIMVASNIYFVSNALENYLRLATYCI